MPDSPTDDRPIIQRLGPASIVAVFFAVAPLMGIGVLAVNIKWVSEFLREDWWRGLGIYVGGFAVLSGFALLPTWPQSLVGGWAFGMVWGAPAAVAAVTVGSVIGTEIARGASGHRVEAVIDENPRWRAVRDALVGGSFWKTVGMVALIRLPPNSPFAIVNLLLGATEVPRLANVLGTLIGIAPRTVCTVWIGTAIQKELTREDVTQAMPRWLWISGILVMLGVLMVIGRVAQKAIDGITAKEIAESLKSSAAGAGESAAPPTSEGL